MNKKLSKAEIYDITEWDSVNWGKAISFINDLDLPIEGKKVLELGSNNGGMSLFFAKRGAKCTCTDLKIPGEGAEAKHKKWHVDGNISYAALDATDYPEEYRDSFDIITFKSVLGGIGSDKNIAREKQMVREIGKALKAGGYVVFIENLRSTKLHGILRRKFRKHGNSWHYQTDRSLSRLFKDYELVDKQFFGFLGLFGPKEVFRRILGTIDCVFDRILPKDYKYIGVYVFRKR
ncbi:MAG: class I SAM-dependent methyltransferase [Lachnospiraceae bacterium]|nr:class I SAM-dependent methyltransferase [Lachnospiraceae bacterium]